MTRSAPSRAHTKPLSPGPDVAMAANKKLLILAGDGIGPEVMGEVRRVVDWMDRRRHVSFDIAEALVGGAAIDAEGGPISDATMDAATGADAVLLGACGLVQMAGWFAFEIRPEAGCSRLRKDLELFANLRPAWCSRVRWRGLDPEDRAGRGARYPDRPSSPGGRLFRRARGIETLEETGGAGASTRRSTRHPRSSASRGSRSTSRASGATASAPSRRPT